MRIALVAAYDRNRLIGRDNALPWHLPADLRRFRRLTRGKPVIMGRRTFASMGAPLPERRNIVLTHDPAFRAVGVEVARSADEALKRCAGADEVMVIGGGGVFAEFLPRADRLYLTEIDAAFEGDAYFPPFDRREWIEFERERHEPDARHAYAYAFVTLERKRR